MEVSRDWWRMLGRYAWLGCGLGLAVAAACSEETAPPSSEAVAGDAGDAAVGAGTAGGKRNASAGEPDRGGSRPTLVGVAGDGGAGGSVGAGPSAGPPAVINGADCTGAELELDGEVVRRCVVALSCLGPDGGSVSGCVQYWPKFAGYHLGRFGGDDGEELDRPLQFATHLEPCVDAPLDGCDDVLACSGMRAAADECDGALATRCEGDLAINCSTNEIKDCKRLTGEAGRCRELDGKADCLVVPACAEEDGTFACDGDLAYGCRGGIGYGTDCSQRGMTCGMVAGFSLCRDRELPTETCTNVGETACDGDAMTFCDADGVLFTHDCGESGMTCTDEGPAEEGPTPEWLDCVVAGCKPGDSVQDHCVGDDLVLPLSMPSEAAVRLHCPDYGFATCQYDRCAN